MKTNGNDPVHLTCVYTHEPSVSNPGMTKREHFAAMSMQGILSGNRILIQTPKNVCSTAVEYADALIAALNKD